MEAILFTPIIPAQPHAPRGKQPSPEQIVSASILYISPSKRSSEVITSAPSSGFDNGSAKKRRLQSSELKSEASVSFEFPAPEHKQSVQSNAVASAHHLVFEDFTLLSPNKAGLATNRIPKEYSSQLFAIFPGTTQIEIFHPFLRIVVIKLPPKPWPVSVAGKPLYVTTDEYDYGFDHGIYRFGEGEAILTELDSAKERHSQILRSTVSLLKSHRLLVEEITYWGDFITIRPSTDEPAKSLPSKITGRNVCYQKFGEARRPDSDRAYRGTEPLGLIQDGTNYACAESPLLRPGIMLSSPNRTLSSSGIAVQNRADKHQFITMIYIYIYICS